MHPRDLAGTQAVDSFSFNDLCPLPRDSFWQADCWHGVGHGAFRAIVARYLSINVTSSPCVVLRPGSLTLQPDKLVAALDVCDAAIAVGAQVALTLHSLSSHPPPSCLPVRSSPSPLGCPRSTFAPLAFIWLTLSLRTRRASRTICLLATLGALLVSAMHSGLMHTSAKSVSP
jgi:hypothetical protein